MRATLKLHNVANSHNDVPNENRVQMHYHSLSHLRAGRAMIILIALTMIAGGQNRLLAQSWPFPEHVTVTLGETHSCTLLMNDTTVGDYDAGSVDWSNGYDQCTLTAYISSGVLHLVVYTITTIPNFDDDGNQLGDSVSSGYEYFDMNVRLSGLAWEFDYIPLNAPSTAVTSNYSNRLSTPASGIAHVKQSSDQWNFIGRVNGADWFRRESGGDEALVISTDGNDIVYQIFGADGVETRRGLIVNRVFIPTFPNPSPPEALSIRDGNGGFPSNSAPSVNSGGKSGVWVSGISYTFQGNATASGVNYDVFASEVGGIVRISGSGALTGDNGYPYFQEFSGTFVLDSFFNITYTDSNLTGPFGFGAPSAPSNLSNRPQNIPPAVKVTINSIAQVWPWFTTYNNVNYYLDIGPGEPTSWLELSGATPGVANLVGVAGVNGPARYQYGVFQDMQVTGDIRIQSAQTNGDLWTPVSPLIGPRGFYVGGELWFLVSSNGSHLDVDDPQGESAESVYWGTHPGHTLVLNSSWGETSQEEVLFGVVYSFRLSPTNDPIDDVQGSATYGTTTGWVMHPEIPDISRWLDVRALDVNGSWLQTDNASWGPPRIGSSEGTWEFTHRPESQNNADVYVRTDSPNQTLWIDAFGHITDSTGAQLAGKYNGGRFQDTDPALALVPLDIVIPDRNNSHPNEIKINGVVWTRGTDSNGSQDVYLGPHVDQRLVISANGSVSYVNPTAGINTSGMYFGDRHFAFNNTLSNSHTIIADGTATNGTGRKATTFSNGTSISEDGSLDITGNFLSLGTLMTNASMSGFTLDFDDSPLLSRLRFIATREKANWVWEHGTNNSNSTIPMMRLNETNTLQLLDSQGRTGMSLSPQGTISSGNNTVTVDGDLSVRGVFRVNPSGDIRMDYANGPRP